MKKTLLFFAAALMCMAVNAQTAFSENFNNVADGAIPTGWVTYGDGLANYSSYSSFNDSWQAYNGQMVTISWTNQSTACDRWLATPQITVPTTNPMLIFDISGVAYGPESQYAEKLKIMVSTTDNQKASFSLLQDLGGLLTGSNTYSVNLAEYAGQNVYLAFVNYGDGMYMFLDNVSVEPVVDYGVALVDAKANWLVPTGSNTTVTVTVKNTGFNNLTSFDIEYSVNGGATQTQNISNVNVPTFGTTTGTFTYTQAEAGAANFAITVTNPNGETVSGATGNTGSASTTFYTSDQAQQRTSVLEHFTTARCPNCPSGHQRLEGAINGREDRVVWIAHHSGYYTDDMTINESEDAMKYFNDGGATYAPACMIDRNVDNATSEDPGPVFFPDDDITTVMTRALAVPSLVTVEITNVNYNEQTRELSATVSGQFTADVAFDSPRVHLFVLEDSIMASQSGVSGKYQHNHVLRACVSGLDGVSDGFTTTNSGDTYSKTFTYTLPTKLRAHKTWLAAFVSNHNDDVNRCQIHNGAKTGRLLDHADPTTTTGITAAQASVEVKTYPNPATEMAYVSAENTIRSYEVVNAMGQVVMAAENVNADVLELNVSNMPQGVYYISVTTDNGVATQRLTVVK